MYILIIFTIYLLLLQVSKNVVLFFEADFNNNAKTVSIINQITIAFKGFLLIIYFYIKF